MVKVLLQNIVQTLDVKHLCVRASVLACVRGCHVIDKSVLLAERDMRDAPCWKRSAYWVCGIEKTPEVELTEDEQRALDMKNTSLVEVSTWKRANNINAVILITFAVFVWGFFA